MHEASPPMAAQTQPIPRTTELQGVRLALTRIAWAAALLFSAAVYWEMIPSNYGTTATQWSVEQSYWGASGWLSYRQWVWLAIALGYLVGAVFASTALLIFWRRPRDWVALTVSASFLLLSVFFGINGNLDTLRLPALFQPAFRVVARFLPAILTASVLVVVYVFPNGRFVPRWGAWIVAAAILLPSAAQIAERSMGAADSEVGWRVWIIVFPLALLFGIGAQIFRYLRVATTIERQQTKWVLWGLVVSFGLLIFAEVLNFGIDGSGRDSKTAAVLFVVQPIALLALPISIAVSLLRYGLWDVDTVINRTLLYGALTGALLLIYGLVVGAAALVFGLQQNPALAVVATGFAAVLIGPLERRLQRAINVFTYGMRDEAVVVLQRMGRQLETAAAPDIALTAMTRTVAQSLKLPYAALELTAAQPGDNVALDTTAAWGSPIGALVRFPLRFQSEELGALVVSERTQGERLSRGDRTLLASVAQQAGPAVQAMLLNSRLQQSRTALVAAREDERRRLRRDLHDGLGPQLASQTLTIDAIVRYLDHDPGRAAALLQDLKSQSQEAVRDIRRIVYALRPPALDDLGLLEALAESVARAGQNDIHVELEAPSALPPLPAAIEAAAYRIAQEAMSNALRHANAHSIAVSLWIEEDLLHIEVRDDGTGVAVHAPSGVGMHSMHERAAEVGGAFSFVSSSAGASAHATLPVA